jgi:hypothetical protein
MKIDCPRCRARITAAQMNLEAESAVCIACGAAFSLAEVAARAAESSSDRGLERPYDARIIVEGSPTELKVCVPARGHYGALVGMIAFSSLYLVVIYYWTRSALDDPRNLLAWNAILLSLGISLSICGLGPLGLAAWSVSRVLEVRIDSDQALFRTRGLGLENVIQKPRQDLQGARRHEPFALNLPFPFRARSPGAVQPIRGVEFVFRDGPVPLPVETEAEGIWLTRTINDFLTRTPARTHGA